MSEIVDLSFFPGKGMRRATVEGSYIGVVAVRPTGFELNGIGDREIYVVAGDSNGQPQVITPRGRGTAQGREHEYPGDRAIKRIDVSVAGYRQLKLSAEGVGMVALDLDSKPHEYSEPAALHNGTVWGYDLGGAAADFIREVTGRADATIYCIDREAPRLVGPNQLRSSLAADSQPFTLGTSISLAALHDARQGSNKVPIPMERYRPNIEVDDLGDAGAFAEHCARAVRLGGLVFRPAAGVVRCVVTNLDKQGNMVGGGLSVLRSRRGHRVDDNGVAEAGQPEPIFCISLNLEPGQEGKLAIGMPAEVLEWGDPNMVLA